MADITNERAETEEPEAGRRGLFAALLGLGVVGLAGCGVDAHQSLPEGNLGRAKEDLTGTSFAWFDSIFGSGTNMKGTSGTANQIAIAQGYSSAGDGGGGIFWWDTSAKTDDGGTIINPAGGTNQGWRRIYSGPINVKWFGAKGDGTTTDTTAVNSAIALANSKGAVTLYFPTGNYVVGPLNSITASDVWLIGDTAESTALTLPGNTTTPVIQFGSSSSTVSGGGIRDLTLYYTSVPTVHTTAILIANAVHIDISQLAVNNASTLAQLGTSSTTANNVYFSHLRGLVSNSGYPTFYLANGACFYGHDIQLSVGGTNGDPQSTLDGTHFMNVQTGSGTGWDTIELRGTLAYLYARGVWLYAAATGTGVISFVQMVDCTFDYCRFNAIYAHADSTASGYTPHVSNILISNCVLTAYYGAGVSFDTTGATGPSYGVQYVTIANSLIHATQGQAIFWGASAAYLAITGCVFAATNTGGGSSTIEIGSGAKYFTVSGCTMDSQYSVGVYGIKIGADCDNYSVTGNVFKGSSGSCSIAANASASKSRLYTNNVPVDYQTHYSVTLPGSGVPWSNTTPFRIQFIVGSNGTGTSMAKESGGTYYPISLSFGTLDLGPGESISVGYTSAPSASYFVLG